MAGTRRRLAPAFAAGVALAVLPAGPATASPSVSQSVSSSVSPSVTVDRTIRDERIAESSGLAAGLRRPGLLWTHEDSGNSARLFAVRPDGSTAATVRILGVPATDWEAIAAYRDAAGLPMLAVADIGDNAAARSFVEIVVLPEPPARSADVRPTRVIRLRYPTGGVDAETLLVDPDGRRAFVVTKGFGSTVYEVPPEVWRGTAATGPPVELVARAGVPLTFVTDGVMGPGGHPLLRTYGELAALPPLDDDVTGGSLQPLAMMRLPNQRQGESLTLRDARTALVGSEGVRQPVLRIPFPAEVLAALAPAPSPAPAGSTAPAGSPGSPGSSAPTSGHVTAGRDDGSRTPWPPAVTAFAAVLGVVVAVLVVASSLLRRRRSPHP